MAERIALKIDAEYGWIEDRPHYDDIVKTFGEVKASEDQGSYQGDSLYLIEKDGRYGVLTFGWGSCSGCDALEAVYNQADLDSLQDDLERGIKWFDYDYEVLEYLVSGGLKTSFLSADLIVRFASKAQEVLV